MDLILSMHPMARVWLLDGPLSSYVGAFQALLERGRYAEGSSETALRAWSHFSHWMTKCQVSAEQIDEALVDLFLDSHLPRCDCHPAALRTRSDLSAALGHLLALLREQHVIVELPGSSGPIADELHRYNIHMRDTRGLAIGTREGRLARVSQLLQCKVAGKAIAIGELQPEDVRGFIATELTRVNSASHARADPGLPRSSRTRSAQHHPQPQCAAGRAALVPEVRGSARRHGTSVRRACARRADEALRAADV